MLAGAIELLVFSEQFCTELDVVDVQSQRIDRFGVCMRGTERNRERERERRRESQREREGERETSHLTSTCFHCYSSINVFPTHFYCPYTSPQSHLVQVKAKDTKRELFYCMMASITTLWCCVGPMKRYCRPGSPYRRVTS